MEHLLKHYLSDEPKHPQSVREVAKRDQVIPILMDWGGFYGLGMDGQVYSYTFDDNFDPTMPREVEQSPRLRNTVFHIAARQYTDLNHLDPVRQESDKTCPACNGTGSVPDIPNKIKDNVLCYCGGLGWIPADDIYPSY